MWDLLDQTMHIMAQVGNDASTAATDASALAGDASAAVNDAMASGGGAAAESAQSLADTGTTGPAEFISDESGAATPDTTAAGMQEGAVDATPGTEADTSGAVQSLLDDMGAVAADSADILDGTELAEAADMADMGMLSFIAQSDLVGKSLFGLLVLMSLLSWYLIFAKFFSNVARRARTRKFLQMFWTAESLEEVERKSLGQGNGEPFSRLTRHAIQARNHHARYGGTNLEESGSTATFVMRSMRKIIDQETAKLENGLTVLASIGSTAPFVGLFGTVWGVYHALIGIGMSDGVTVNSIAGPVGEALIMTGLGLAVAIPAVLAYNGFVRSNRVYLAQLDTFAHDLFSFLSTGQPVHEQSSANAQPDLRVASGGN